MTSTVVESGYIYLTDRSGNTLINGMIWIGEPNQDPENFPQNAYFDEAHTIPAPNPIRTNGMGFPCDPQGNSQRIYVDGNYSLKIQEQNGAQVYYIASAADGFYGVVSSDLANQVDPNLGTGLVGWNYDATGVGSTLHDKLKRSVVDVRDFGALGDGVTNDKLAFDKAAATGRSILLPAGDYVVPTGDYSGIRFYSFDGATTNNPTISIVDPLSNSLAVGMELTFPCVKSALPFGWVALDGSVLNRNVYAQLWDFAQSSGNIVDEADKINNPLAFGRGNGTTTFSLPNKSGTVQGFADAGASVDPTLALGKRIKKESTSGAGAYIEVGVSTPAIRAFGSIVNQGAVDIQALQAQVIDNTNEIIALELRVADLELLVSDLESEIGDVESKLFGFGQTYQYITRARYTNYTNNTGKPIAVTIPKDVAADFDFTIDGVDVQDALNFGDTTFIIGPGSVYRFEPPGPTDYYQLKEYR